MGENTFFYKAKHDMQSIHWKDILSDCRKKHTRKDFDQAMLTGTVYRPINPHNMLSEWKKPWIFYQAGKIGIITIVCLYLSVLILNMLGFGVSMSLSWMLIVVPPLIMPLVLLTFFWELNIPANISALETFGFFIAGATLSFILNSVMLSLVTNQMPAYAAFREEPAKLGAGLLLLWLWSKRGNKRIYGFTGLLIGAAVGAGFGAFESLSYGIRYSDTVLTTNDVTIVRAILALGGHTVMAAPYMAALALEMKEHNWKLKINSLFLRTFAISTALHFLWNSDLTSAVSLEYLKCLLLIFLYWLQVLDVTKRCFSQILNETVPLQNLHQAGSIQIIGISGDVAGKKVSVKSGNRILVGRGTNCQYQVPAGAQAVSRVHCSIYSDHKGSWLVADQNSSYGTYLNGGRLVTGKGYLLHSGDIICLGNNSQRIRIIL